MVGLIDRVVESHELAAAMLDGRQVRQVLPVPLMPAGFAQAFPVAAVEDLVHLAVAAGEAEIAEAVRRV